MVIKPYCPVKFGDKVYTIRDNAAIGYRVTEKSEGNGWMVISARRNDGRLSFGLLVSEKPYSSPAKKPKKHWRRNRVAKQFNFERG